MTRTSATTPGGGPNQLLDAFTSAPRRSFARGGRRERGKRAKLKRIKRAARKLFILRGFEGTTTRAIAEAADIGAGTLFLYAVTKADLLVLIFREEVGAAVDRAIATLPTAALLDQILHIFAAMIAHHRENPGLARVFVKELPFVDDARHGVDEFMRDLYAHMARLIDAAKARGELRATVSSPLLAHNLFALYFQLLQRWLSEANRHADAGRGARSSADLIESNLRDSLELQLSGLREPGHFSPDPLQKPFRTDS
ncbi:MAG TPA: TetR/AcrR family transcriptional regulator [Candidatus Binataceae bacterium]